MNLASIARICFILSVCLGTAPGVFALEHQSGATPQSPPAQASEPAPTPPSQTAPPPPSAQTKPSSNRPKRHKKTASSNCEAASSDSKTAAPTDSANPNNWPTDAAAPSASQTATPCSAPKKIIRNGGSSEPSIQLSGGAAGQQAMQQRSTEQLTAATEENLKQIAGRQLTAAQQDMVAQIKQFMDQSKSAISAGDPERGRNLAEKAHLLSEELLKP